MNTTTNAKVNTKPEAGAEAVTTNLTLNWEGMTTEDVQALAQQALIVKLQGQWRKNGIPAGDATVNVIDHKVGTRQAPTKQTLEQMIGALSAEEKAALLAKLAG